MILAVSRGIPPLVNLSGPRQEKLSFHGYHHVCDCNLTRQKRGHVPVGSSEWCLCMRRISAITLKRSLTPPFHGPFRGVDNQGTVCFGILISNSKSTLNLLRQPGLVKVTSRRNVIQVRTDKATYIHSNARTYISIYIYPPFIHSITYISSQCLRRNTA